MTNNPMIRLVVFVIAAGIFALASQEMGSKVGQMLQATKREVRR